MIAYQDTHCHLNLNQFDHDLEQVIQRAQQQGVDRILVPGIDLETSRRAVEICEKYDIAFAAVGVHPNNASLWDAGSIEKLRVLCRHPKVVAIGEIGLDYYRNYAEPALQKKILAAQMELAKEISKPLIVHNRNALHDLMPILAKWVKTLRVSGNILAEKPGVLHAFDGDLETAHKAIELGFYVGVAGPVTFSNAKDRHTTTQAIPLTSMIAETDAPYLAPHPFRGKRNEPAWVSLVVQKIAMLKELPLERTITTLTNNGNHLFEWRSAD
ncbi:MAG: TatD family hydrolase [Bellilinea sp.]